MVGDLDPHSEYLSAEEFRDIRVSTTGSYTGIGVEVTEVDGIVRIITPMAGSPAARSGLRSGDEIIAVDGEPVEGDHLFETIRKLRGSAGTTVDGLCGGSDWWWTTSVAPF